ncbi:MAG: PrgI family protein [Gaiellaceae bacterium]
MKVPADVELEDRLAFGLTAKQLGILAATAVSGYGLFLVLAPVLPAPVAVAAMGLVAVAGVLLALVRHDGLAGDQLALAVARFALTPKRQLLAPDGLPAPLPGAPRQPRVAPLDIPVRRVLRSGLVELTEGGYCRLLSARGASFELRSPEEQAAFVAAFERFLNGLSEPIQIDVRSEPIALVPQAEQIEHTTHANALRRAALDHARFLRSLGETRPLQRRQIVLVLRCRDRQPEPAQVALAGRANEAIELLRGADVALELLDGEQTARLLATTLDPAGFTAGSNPTGVIHAQPAQHTNTATDTGNNARAGGRPARPRDARAAVRPGSRRRALAADVRDQRLPA